MVAMNEPTSPLAHVTFARTGKRGVPQQFPRRLFEMLDFETKNADADPQYHKVIAWSESGKSFRIFDVAAFSTNVLPKFFRTSKFSSFQRNLNLYGFAKVRRGVENDSYAHPSFVRDQPESLMHLRKTNTASRRRVVSDVDTRAETPPPVQQLQMPSFLQGKIVVHGFQSWDNLKPHHVSPGRSDSDSSSTGSNDRGKLDLLAFALEQEFAKRSM